MLACRLFFSLQFAQNPYVTNNTQANHIIPNISFIIFPYLLVWFLGCHMFQNIFLFLSWLLLIIFVVDIFYFSFYYKLGSTIICAFLLTTVHVRYISFGKTVSRCMCKLHSAVSRIRGESETFSLAGSQDKSCLLNGSSSRNSRIFF